LVEVCHHGAGQIDRRKVLDGVWHPQVDQIAGPDTPDWMRQTAECA
jgi:hypothetical protein